MATVSFNFTGSTIIVTGGGKGIGRTIALSFLAAGADVIICGRNKPDTLPQANDNSARFVAADVRDPEAAQSVIQFALDQTGRVDALINNAGGGPPAEAATASPRFSETIIKLNLIGPLNFAQAAYNAMIKNSGIKNAGKKTSPIVGNIINIASVSGDRPSPGTAAYGAAKAGLLNLSASLAMEWAPAVRVNAIIVGLAKTDAAIDHYGGDHGIAFIEDNLPMKRMATPEDIANACMFLASDGASYISGAALAVHGGGEPPSFLKLANDAIASAPKPVKGQQK